MALNLDARAQFSEIAAEPSEHASLKAQRGVSRLEMKWAGGSDLKASLSSFQTVG